MTQHADSIDCEIIPARRCHDIYQLPSVSVAQNRCLQCNTGYRRYLKTVSDEHFAIDPAKVGEERKFDGIFVLRTNTDLNPLEAMLCYENLWTVEQTFRTANERR